MADEIVELRGTKEFPEDVSIKPETPQLDAYQMTGFGSERFNFGMDKNKCATALRTIADRIESGQYVLQAGSVFSYCTREDYPMTGVTVRFGVKKH